MVHCLEQEDTQLFISKKLVGQILSLLKDKGNRAKLTLLSNSANDPLMKLVEEIDESCIQTMTAIPDYNDKAVFKLKTR